MIKLGLPLKLFLFFTNLLKPTWIIFSFWFKWVVLVHILSLRSYFMRRHLSNNCVVNLMQNVSKTWGLKGLVFLVAATDSTANIISSIRHCFSYEISMGALIETQHIKIVSHSIHSVAICFENVRNKNLVILLPFIFFWISNIFDLLL